jgi:hypothetical protein
MQDLTNINEMNIEYRNDQNSANKLISFIIDFLLESNATSEGNIGTREYKETIHRRNCEGSYRDE